MNSKNTSVRQTVKRIAGESASTTPKRTITRSGVYISTCYPVFFTRASELAQKGADDFDVARAVTESEVSP